LKLRFDLYTLGISLICWEIRFGDICFGKMFIFSVWIWFYLWFIKWNIFISVGLYVFRQRFSESIEIWFYAMYFKNHDYTDDDLGAPSNVIRWGRITRWMELPLWKRPPLGGEGYQRDVNSLIDRFDMSSESMRKGLSVRWSRH
jgi:hypothetical protein